MTLEQCAFLVSLLRVLAIANGKCRNLLSSQFSVHVVAHPKGQLVSGCVN